MDGLARASKHATSRYGHKSSSASLAGGQKQLPRPRKNCFDLLTITAQPLSTCSSQVSPSRHVRPLSERPDKPSTTTSCVDCTRKERSAMDKRRSVGGVWLSLILDTDKGGTNTTPESQASTTSTHSTATWQKTK